MLGKMIRATKMTSAISGVLMVFVCEAELPFGLSALGFIALLFFVVFGTNLWWGPRPTPSLSTFASHINSGEMGRHIRQTLLPACGRMLMFFVSFFVCHSLWRAAKDHLP